MKVSQRKAVSPIIATLLLIAIAVAAGIIVYVFVNGLAGNLTKSGGNQVTEQLSLDAYTSSIPVGSNSSIILTVRNTGTSSITLSSLYLNGASLGQCASSLISIGVGSTSTLTIGGTAGLSCTPNTTFYSHGGASFTLSAGSSYQVKIVSTDGGTFTFNVIAGGSG